MSSNAILNQDFGSESEDDNFNPAPADESDNEINGDADARLGINANKSRQKESNGIKNEDREDSKDSPARRFNGPGLVKDDDDEDIDGEGAEDGEDEDEDDQDDDDDDEEEVVSVFAPKTKSSVFRLLTYSIGPASKEGTKGPS